MYRKATPIFLHCQTPLHAGSGSDLGIVDLPIQRERHTGFPKIEASSLKGALREAFETNNQTSDTKKIALTFGPENGDEHAGALGFTDARLLLFPVKSLKGIFAYVTCSQVLEKLKNELEGICNPKVNFDLGNFDNLIGQTSDISNLQCTTDGKVMLEEFTIELKQSDKVVQLSEVLAKITGNQDIKNRLVVLSNDVFKDFVTHYTEIITRIKIGNETGTVAEGPFNEEYLPAETIMYSLVLASGVFQSEEIKKSLPIKDENEVMDFFSKGINAMKIVQIGANATLGKGIVKTKF